MDKYILTKTPIGEKFLYEIKNNKGKVLSKHLYKRNFVAATVDGSFFFGRLDLVGKGEHGRRLRIANSLLTHPKECYESYVRFFPKDMRDKVRKTTPFEGWEKDRQKWARGTLERMQVITINQ